MNLIKHSLIYFTLIILVLAGGCFNDKPEKSGLQVGSLSSAIGGVENNSGSRQKVTYTVTLYNYTDEDTNISQLKPLIDSDIYERLADRDIAVNVNKKIAANSSIKIEGKFIFDADGLTKEEITAKKPIIKGFKLMTESVIYLP